MKIAGILIMCVCVATGLTACKGSNSSSKSDSSKVNLTKDSSGTLSDSTMGKVPDSTKKNTQAPAAAGPKSQVDSVTKK